MLTLLPLLPVLTASIAADIPNPARAWTVATSGQLAPGLPGARLVISNSGNGDEQTPVALKDGSVVFITTLSTSSTNNRVACMGAPGIPLSVIAREGTHAPGTPSGSNYSFLHAILGNDSTHVALLCYSTLTGFTVYYGNPSTWTPLAIGGTSAPGLSSLSYSTNLDFSGFSLSNDNHFTFVTGLTGPGTGAGTRAIWITDVNGPPVLVARSGAQAPGVPSGVSFNNFRDYTTSVNAVTALDGGGAFFYAEINSGSVSNNTGLWSGRPDALTLVVRKGDHAPTLSGDTTISQISQQNAHCNGVCAFRASLAGADITSGNNVAIYRGTSYQNLEIIARRGSVAPGYPDQLFGDIVTSETSSRPHVNQMGQVLINGTFLGSNDAFLAIVNPDGTSLPILRKGQHSTELSANEVIGDGFGTYGFTDEGDVFLAAGVRDTVTQSLRFSLWTWSQQRGLRLLVLAGERLPVSYTTSAVVDPFPSIPGTAIAGYYNPTDGLVSFANRHNIVVRLPFADGSIRIVSFDTSLYACGHADVGQLGGSPGYDGQLDYSDFIVFLDLYTAHNTIADKGTTGGVAGADGAYDNNDLIVFIDEFFEGCP